MGWSVVTMTVPGHIYFLIFAYMLRLETGLSPPLKYFTYGSKAVLLLWIIYVFSVLCVLCFCGGPFMCALWSPAGKKLTS